MDKRRKKSVIIVNAATYTEKTHTFYDSAIRTDSSELWSTRVSTGKEEESYTAPGALSRSPSLAGTPVSSAALSTGWSSSLESSLLGSVSQGVEDSTHIPWAIVAECPTQRSKNTSSWPKGKRPYDVIDTLEKNELRWIQTLHKTTRLFYSCLLRALLPSLPDGFSLLSIPSTDCDVLLNLPLRTCF